MSATPLTLASTAAQFFETLVATRLLEGAPSDQVRKRMLAGMVEDRLAAYVRQIFLYRFEVFAHDGEYEGRKRSSEELNGAWLAMEKDYYGPRFEPFEGTQYHWSRIPHFFHSPLQTYSYSFGGLLASALFADFLEDIGSGQNDFTNKLQCFLSAGGSKAPEELIALFGLDVMRPSFWDGGLIVLNKLVDELEAL